MRRWSRYPQPPTPRQPCDCAALVEQNATLRAQNEALRAALDRLVLYTRFELRDSGNEHREPWASILTQCDEALEAAVLDAEVDGLAVEVGEGGS